MFNIYQKDTARLDSKLQWRPSSASVRSPVPDKKSESLRCTTSRSTELKMPLRRSFEPNTETSIRYPNRRRNQRSPTKMLIYCPTIPFRLRHIPAWRSPCRPATASCCCPSIWSWPKGSSPRTPHLLLLFERKSLQWPKYNSSNCAQW